MTARRVWGGAEGPVSFDCTLLDASTRAVLAEGRLSCFTPAAGAGLRRRDVKRRVLVTGASRGIGRAIAVRLARDGFSLTINFRERRDDAEQTAQAIREAGGEAALLPFDVADRDACAEALEADLQANGSYYGVVCNAGVHADGPVSGPRRARPGAACCARTWTASTTCSTRWSCR